MRTEFEHPLRIDARTGSRIQPRRLYDFRRHQPPSDPSGRYLALRSLGGRGPLTRLLLPFKQRRSGKHIHAPVVSRMIIAFVGMRRDVSEQARQDRSMDSAVFRRAERELQLLPRFHSVIHGCTKKSFASAQGFLELAVNVAPLAHARERKEMRGAKFPQFSQ